MRFIDAIRQRLLLGTLATGLAIGLVFPLATRFFAEFRSPALLGVFWAVCAVAGLALGLVCFQVAYRLAEGVVNGVLADARATLNVQIADSRDMDEARKNIATTFAYVSGVLSQFRNASSTIKALSADILASTEQQASGATEQAAAVTETSATLEELAQTSKQIADNSESVVRVAEHTLASAEEGMTTVNDTAAGIEEIRLSTQQASDRILALGERSQEIGRVLTIIDEIAEQTKILALNAAIEAARAGEAGKGFSVVAEEIRKLADSVTESTQEIGRVVREIQASTSALVMATERAAKKVDEGKDLAHRTADALDRIVSQVEETTDAAKQISIATQQQRTASEQVVVSMREVAGVSRQAAESSRQVANAVLELNGLADAMVNQ